MAKLNISQAAKAVGRSRPILYKKIKNGELSAEVGEDGGKFIDTAELIRVFGELVTHDVVSTDVNNLQYVTPNITGVLQQQIKRLEEENQRLLVRIDADRRDGARFIEDLRNDRDAWRRQAETLLITQAQEQPALIPQPAPAPSLWHWLIPWGRKTA